MKVVQHFQTIASTTTSEAVKAESVDILQQIQGILDPSVRPKVDYDEAVDNMRVFTTLWSAGNPAGSQSFIPNLVDKDMVMNAFQILTVATEEWKLIHKEYVDSFGYEGVDLYNLFLENIPDEQNKALPFVNTCFQARKERL